MAHPEDLPVVGGSTGEWGTILNTAVGNIDDRLDAVEDDYYDKSESDGRYVEVAGDTMSGPLVVPDASADEHALNRSTADARYVNTDGDTMTGTLMVDKTGIGLRLRQGSSMYLESIDGDTRATVQSLDGMYVRIRATSPTAYNILQATLPGDGILRLMPDQGVVEVPAATAADQAAQVTAIDPTTGQLAIGGIEMGDTGWRDLSAGASYLGQNDQTCRIRRIGSQVHFRVSCDATAMPSNNADVVAIPTGFRADWTYLGDGGWYAVGGQVITGQYMASGVFRVNKGTASAINLRGSWTWTTLESWPASLPGTAV